MTKPSRNPLLLMALLYHASSATLQAETPSSAVDYDWYTLKQLEAWPSSTPQSESERRQLSICGGTFWEPPRHDIGLASPKAGSILGSAFSYQFEEDHYAKLLGSVILQQDSMQIESDQVEIDFTSNTAFIQDNVRFRDQSLLLLGDYGELSLESGKAHFTGARYTLHQQHIRGHAQSIYSAPPGTMAIYSGIYTGCVPGDNDWYFRGEEINLDADRGWGTAKHMTLHIKHLPVMYIPYFRFPIDDQRHSGLLYPSFDSLTQPDLSLPIYLNLAPNYDLTLTPRKIGGRGTLWQSEFRFLTPITGLGQLNFAIMPEDRKRDNEARKSARWQEQADWGLFWQAHLDLNYVSDADYLDDFGTDLSTISDSHLVRALRLDYLRDQWSFGVRFQSWQTIDASIADNDLPYRRLPELTLQHQVRHTLFDAEPNRTEQQSADGSTPKRLDQETSGQSMMNAEWINAEWNNSAQLVYFEQPQSNHSNTHPAYATRLHYESTFSMPIHWEWGFVRPSATLYATHYQLGSLEGDALSRELSTQTRTLASASLDTGLFFERYIQQAEHAPEAPSSGHFTLQTLEPRLFFLAIPDKAQGDLPLLDTSELTFSMSQLFRTNRFSGHDRIGDAQQVSAAVTSRLISGTSGKEFARTSIGQIFYFDDRNVLLEGDSSDTDDASEQERTTSNIITESQLQWRDFWSSRVTLEWNPHDDTIEQGQFQINYLVNERELYHLGYRFRQADSTSEEEISQYDLSMIHPYSDRWDIIAAWNFDLKKRQTLEQLTGLSYSSCCWRSSLVYRRRIEDTNTASDDPTTKYSLMLEFELIGLGQLGGKLQSLMEKSIFGYDQFID